jgi:chromosome segregation ATPase
MKNSISVLMFTTLLMSGGIFTGCESFSQKADSADNKVQDAKQDLKKAETDAALANQKAAVAEEWRVFKADTDIRIKANESAVVDLKAKMKTSGKKMDDVYSASIDALEQKNKDLQARLDNYEKNQSDWASFKREFNHDMDELGQAFKDLTVNNKK